VNTEEVVAMMDAITEGRNYDLEVAGDRESDNVRLQFASDSFAISHDPNSFAVTEVTNPRVAREIAGALVAWANRKDSSTKGGKDAVEITAAVWGAPARVNSGGVGGTDATNPSSRAEWFRRNVNRMTQETKDRNLKDLRAILSDPMTRHEEHSDIQAAIMILLNAGAR
jgi:hypothetical protein